MASETRLENALKSAEEELNLIKNQIQQTLVDIREYLLESTNPFVLPAFPGLEPATEDSALADSKPDSTDAEEEDEEEGVEGDTDEISDETGEPEDEEEFLEEGLEDPGEEDLLFDDSTGAPADTDPFAELDEDDEPEDEEDSEEPAGEQGLDMARGAGLQAMDFISLVSLLRWVSATLDRMGRSRLEVLLDAYEQSGRISAEVKAIALTLCELADEDPESGIPVRDVVRAMMRFEGVLGNENPDGARLLSILFDDDLEQRDSLFAGLGMY